MADYTVTIPDAVPVTSGAGGGVNALKVARANLEQILATETAWQISYGPKPSYSIDGESVPWDDWRARMIANIDALTKMIVARAPYIIKTRQHL